MSYKFENLGSGPINLRNANVSCEPKTTGAELQTKVSGSQ